MSALGLYSTPVITRTRSEEATQARFLAAFAECGNTVRACRWSRVSRQMHYRWMKVDPTYPARFAEAKRRAIDRLEDEMVRRGHEGTRKPVLYKGKPVYIHGEMLFETEFSDNMLALALKANLPEKYRERHEIATVWDGDLTKLTDEQLSKLQEQFLVLAEAERRKQLEAAQTVEATVEVVEPAKDSVSEEPSND
jgi:hypothetical protein